MSRETEKRLIGHPAFPAAVRGLALGLRQISHHAPNLASLFATQQRWLLSHAVLAHYCRSLGAPAPGFTRADCAAAATVYALASRNTALEFFDQALKYRVVTPLAPAAKGRDLRVGPSPETLAALTGWYLLHLQALDLIDGGDRRLRFAASGEAALAAIEPGVAERLLTDERIRKPGPIYVILTWMDEGGILMDRLVSGADPLAGPEAERMTTDITSISALSASLNLSRTHTGRKLAAVEAIGGLGWTKGRGRSPLWISRAFWDEYAEAQAIKLAIMLEAWGAAEGRIG